MSPLSPRLQKASVSFTSAFFIYAEISLKVEPGRSFILATQNPESPWNISPPLYRLCWNSHQILMKNLPILLPKPPPTVDSFSYSPLTRQRNLGQERSIQWTTRIHKPLPYICNFPEQKVMSWNSLVQQSELPSHPRRIVGCCTILPIYQEWDQARYHTVHHKKLPRGNINPLSGGYRICPPFVESSSSSYIRLLLLPKQ